MVPARPWAGCCRLSACLGQQGWGHGRRDAGLAQGGGTTSPPQGDRDTGFPRCGQPALGWLLQHPDLAQERGDCFPRDGGESITPSLLPPPLGPRHREPPASQPSTGVTQAQGQGTPAACQLTLLPQVPRARPSSQSRVWVQPLHPSNTVEKTTPEPLCPCMGAEHPPSRPPAPEQLRGIAPILLPAPLGAGKSEARPKGAEGSSPGAAGTGTTSRPRGCQRWGPA